MNQLGTLLRELRGKRSLREIAEITELSHTYIADIEKGYRRGTKKPIHPSPETLKRLADAYDYPYPRLMQVAGYIESKPLTLTPKDESNIINDLQKILDGLEGCYAAFDGVTPEEVEDQELLKASLEQSMRLAKRLAKEKFTPNKHK